jgi:UDP-glucose 6-dehydrogenase
MIKSFFNDKKIGIVGYGFVGRATHRGILNDMPVTIHDITRNTVLSDLQNVDIAFFCIPTDDQEDINQLLHEINELKQLNKECKIIIRSTVPLGTCKIIQNAIQDKIMYIPEFFRQRSWESDCNRRPLILGHNGLNVVEWIGNDEFLECSLEEAELIKMFNNNIAALKIVFANHFYDLAKHSGCNYDLITSLFLQVGHDQTYIEANEDLRGFGGK